MKRAAGILVTVGVFGCVGSLGCSKSTSALTPGGGSGGEGGGDGTGGNGGGSGGGGGDGGGHVGPTNPPPGGKFPIDHIIVVVKENHTFDNYFGSFPGAEGTQSAQTSMGQVAVGRAPAQLTRDLCHLHDCALTGWNHGAMDHWD